MGWAERLRADLARDAPAPDRGAIGTNGTIGSLRNCQKDSQIRPIGTIGTIGIDENGPDRVAEREAIQAEPNLPPPGSPERNRLDQWQAAMVAGLLAGFHKHRRRHS